MQKFICDICGKEIDMRKPTHSALTYFKISLLTADKGTQVAQVMETYCESCTPLLQQKLDDLKKEGKK